MSTQYLLSIFLTITKLATLFDYREKIIPIAFWVTVKVKLLVFISALSAQYFMNHLLDNYQTLYKGCLRKWIMHYVFATLLNFAPGEHLCISIFLVNIKLGHILKWIPSRWIYLSLKCTWSIQTTCYKHQQGFLTPLNQK